MRPLASQTSREPNGLGMAPPPPTIWHNMYQVKPDARGRGGRSNSGWRIGERPTTAFNLDGYIRLESAWQMSEELISSIAAERAAEEERIGYISSRVLWMSERRMRPHRFQIGTRSPLTSTGCCEVILIQFGYSGCFTGNGKMGQYITKRTKTWSKQRQPNGMVGPVGRPLALCFDRVMVALYIA